MVDSPAGLSLQPVPRVDPGDLQQPEQVPLPESPTAVHPVLLPGASQLLSLQQAPSRPGWSSGPAHYLHPDGAAG